MKRTRTDSDPPPSLPHLDLIAASEEYYAAAERHIPGAAGPCRHSTLQQPACPGDSQPRVDMAVDHSSPSARVSFCTSSIATPVSAFSRRGEPPSTSAADAQAPNQIGTSCSTNRDVVQASANSKNNNSLDMSGIWPSRSYGCTFCGRKFNSAQALGGHMNIHRRDRARLRTSLDLGPPSRPPPLSAFSDYQTSIFPSPHAAHQSLPRLIIPFSQSAMGDYKSQHPFMTPESLDRVGMPNRRGLPSWSMAVSHVSTHESSSHHSSNSRSYHPMFQTASQREATSEFYASTGAVTSTNSTPQVPSLNMRPRSPGSSTVSKLPDVTPRSWCHKVSPHAVVLPFNVDDRALQGFIDGEPLPLKRSGSCVLIRTGDLKSLHSIAAAACTSMEQPGGNLNQSLSSLDLELRLGQSSSFFPASAAGSN